MIPTLIIYAFQTLLSGKTSMIKHKGLEINIIVKQF